MTKKSQTMKSLYLILIFSFNLAHTVYAQRLKASFAVDNCYAIYLGDKEGAVKKVLPKSTANGVINKTPQTIFQATKVTTDYQPGDWLYMIAWSDDKHCQGLIGEFSDAKTLKTGDPGWEVFGTSRNADAFLNNAPTSNTVNRFIGKANAEQLWTQPASGELNKNTAFQCRAYSKVRSVKGISNDASWIWHDTGKDKQKGAPFSGFNHDEFLIFRFPVQLISGAESTLVPLSSGLDVDFDSVSCDQPAYDANGQVQYIAKAILTNTSNNNTTLSILSTGLADIWVSRTDGSIPSAITPLSLLPPTITLGPGTSTSFTFSFSRPIGEVDAHLNVRYFINNSTVAAKTYDPGDLPNCACSACDQWRILVTLQDVEEHDSPTANTELLTNIQFPNTDGIKEVRAEIVSIRHTVSDPQCATCTTHDEHMGMFSSGTVTSKTGPGTPNTWQNNGTAQFIYNEDGDGYANSLIWKASDPSVGIVGGGLFKTFLNMPSRSKLECCSERYRICVRWTFTDVNCVTCEKLVCYGGGGKGGGSGGVGLPQKRR